MVATEIVSFLFKIINFGAFIGLAFYLFESKLKKKVKMQIAEKELFLEKLYIIQQQIVDRNNTLDNKRDSQNKHGNELLKKIELWHKSVFSQEQLMIEKAKLKAQKSYEKEQIFYEKKEKQEILKLVAPLVVIKARNELEFRFSQEKNAQNYMNVIFNCFQKSSL